MYKCNVGRNFAIKKRESNIPHTSLLDRGCWGCKNMKIFQNFGNIIVECYIDYNAYESLIGDLPTSQSQWGKNVNKLKTLRFLIAHK